MSTPQEGHRHDLFQIQQLFDEICTLVKEVGINLKDLFLNADPGFDSQEFRQACQKENIIPNVNRTDRLGAPRMSLSQPTAVRHPHWCWLTLILRVSQVMIILEFLHRTNLKADAVENFWQIQDKWAQISLILKTEGYSLENQEKIKGILRESSSGEAQIFTQTVLNYLQELSQKPVLLTRLYCCSDIIESAFGKLKQKLATSSSAHLTEFIFTLASMGGHYQSQEVKKALESIKDKDLRNSLRKAHKNESKTNEVQLVSV